MFRACVGGVSVNNKTESRLRPGRRRPGSLQTCECVCAKYVHAETGVQSTCASKCELERRWSQSGSLPGWCQINIRCTTTVGRPSSSPSRLLWSGSASCGAERLLVHCTGIVGNAVGRASSHALLYQVRRDQRCKERAVLGAPHPPNAPPRFFASITTYRDTCTIRNMAKCFHQQHEMLESSVTCADFSGLSVTGKARVRGGFIERRYFKGMMLSLQHHGPAMRE